MLSLECRKGGRMKRLVHFGAVRNYLKEIGVTSNGYRFLADFCGNPDVLPKKNNCMKVLHDGNF